MPYYGRHDSSLQLFKQISWNEETKGFVYGTSIISQKILNQAIYLGSCGFYGKSQPIIKL